MSSVAVPEPDEASYVAVSAVLGTDAPEAPPVVADQLVVLFQLPVPPVTQNRAAMLTPRQARQPQAAGCQCNRATCRIEPASWPQSQHRSSRGYPLDAAHPKSH